MSRTDRFFTKNGYGMLVTMTIEEYERLSDPLERLLDETYEYCRGTVMELRRFIYKGRNWRMQI